MHDSLQRGQRQVQQVKMRLGLQIDDKQFQQMIVDSGVSLRYWPEQVRMLMKGTAWP
jgi:hypothetical protein